MVGSTDIIPIITSLLKLFGCVNLATTNCTQEIEKSELKRFIYTPKASRSERNAGLGGFEEKQRCADGFRNPTREPFVDRIHGLTTQQNHHPTVKPVSLMRYLCRLITPPEGTVLDPFMGSGSTGIAAQMEGFKFIGIERDEDYFKIAEARMKVPVQACL